MPQMKRLTVVAVCLSVLIVTASGAGAQSLAFTAIDFPGAILTNAQGINARGEIVGFYTDAAGRTHGFVQSSGQFRSIDYPGARLTRARGIGPAGDIVGNYQRQGESGSIPTHGYLLTRGGDFFRVDFPEHQNTIPQRILPDGTILGCYHDEDTMRTMFGFSLSRRGSDRITQPASMHNGATPNGEMIVGLYTDMMDGRQRGYILRRGDFSPLEVPGSVQTAAWDVNPSGLVVGVYRDSAGAAHGFQYDGEAFTQVDVPGAITTLLYGINAHGDMVGAFVDASGRTHGFLARWVP